MDGIGRSQPNTHAQQTQGIHTEQNAKIARESSVIIKAFTKLFPEMSKEIKGKVIEIKVLEQRVEKGNEALQELGSSDPGQSTEIRNQQNHDRGRIQDLTYSIKNDIKYCKEITQFVRDTVNATR